MEEKVRLLAPVLNEREPCMEAWRKIKRKREGERERKRERASRTETVGHPDPALGAITSFLKPFYRYVSPKVGKSSKNDF